MSAELRERVGGAWQERAGAWWRLVEAGEVRPAARALREGGARLATILARGGEVVLLSWHFAAGGELLALELALPRGGAAPSIVDIFPGADWAERETRDYFALRFEGRADTPPLVLRPEDEPGILVAGGGTRCRT